MTDDELDEDDPKWLVNEQIKGLLEGDGASEDHESVLDFLRSTGLPEGTVRRVHRAIVHGDTKVLLSEPIQVPDEWVTWPGKEGGKPKPSIIWYGGETRVEEPKCEVCGAPAVGQVFDMLRYVDGPTGLPKARHYGQPHFYCEEHSRKSYWTEMGPIYAPPQSGENNG